VRYETEPDDKYSKDDQMTRRWECDGIFVSMTGRVVKLIQYARDYVGIDGGQTCLLEDQRTGEIFEPGSAYDTVVGGDFNEMEILALMASDEPIRL